MWAIMESLDTIAYDTLSHYDEHHVMIYEPIIIGHVAFPSLYKMCRLVTSKMRVDFFSSLSAVAIREEITNSLGSLTP